MTAPQHARDVDQQPIGTEQPRSSAPLVALIVLYGVWFVFLVAMALQQAMR